MEFVVTRDSVAAGDDVDAPHERRFAFPDATTVEQAIDGIVMAGYLAGVQGGATWSVVSRGPVSVVAQAWRRGRAVGRRSHERGSLRIEDGAIRLHFNYHGQLAPEVVLAVLERLKLDWP